MGAFLVLFYTPAVSDTSVTKPLLDLKRERSQDTFFSTLDNPVARR